ncbi:MAG TPA: hypothetical protein VFJ72_13645 [Rubrobacteraceae bacterium]|nr:hypothetical protein [Rubrobacteraceae bacterium]
MVTSRRVPSGSYARLAVVGSLVVIAAFVAASAVQAAVSISRAEISGTQLRIEGQAIANSTITVDGVAMGTSDGAGKFKIDRSGFTAPADCTVDVNDGSATAATARLSGCTVSSTPPPASSVSLSSLTVSPTDVVGGDPATGTVTLSSAAPTGGFVIDLSSDNTAAATVPPSVTVPAGSTSATFTVSTKAVTNAQSAVIIGTVGGDFSTEKHAVITAWDPFHFSNGSISILPGGNGSGRVTSQPAGIDCAITLGNGSGACSVFFPVGTVVKLDARAAAGSAFVGWRTGLPGCFDPSKVTVARGTNITCQPGFVLK